MGVDGGAPVRWSPRDTWRAAGILVVTLLLLVVFPLVLVLAQFGSVAGGD